MTSEHEHGNERGRERKQTDQSLRDEREKTDRALGERQAAVEEKADQVMDHARETADAVLVAAREKADGRLSSGAAPSTTRDAVAREREMEDATLRSERATADASLQRERDENARILLLLLPMERDKTDRFLLTERERSDDALAHRDDFLGIVSHDLRSLLGGVVLSATQILKSAPAEVETEELRVRAGRIQRYAARMNRLIGDLVDVASIDAGKLAISPVHGDVTTLISEAVDLFQGAAAAKNISLRMDPLAGSGAADFDYDRLLQVFANLLTNAIKFTPEGGAIHIGCERTDDELVFSVSDTGSGIPAEMRDAIFDRFWQVGKNDRRGLGLGLYISRCIVEAHGGRIRAESTAGGGSRLVFTLPLGR